MKTILTGFILTFFLVFGCAVATAEPQQPVSATQLDSVEQRLTHQQALMQKDIDRVQYLYSLELDRIRDIADSTDRFGLLLTVFGGILTILLFIGSWAIYVTVSNKAKEEAKQAAKQWFDSHEQQHQARLDALQAKFDQLDARTIEFQDTIQANSVRMQQQVDKVKAASDAAETQIEDAKQALQQRLNHSTEEITQLTEAQKQVLNQQNQNLRKKPEAAYTFKDWDDRAFNAYEQGQLDKAALFWGNAAEVVNATDEKVAQALFNKAATLGQLGQFESEINVYDGLINQFGDSTEPALQEPVAKALVNKGVRLGQMKLFAEVIECCDELVVKFAKIDTDVLQEQVAKAQVYKGMTLGQMGQHVDAVTVFDEVIRQFGTSDKILLKQLVAQAMANKGLMLVSHMGQFTEAVQVFGKVAAQFGQSNTLILKELVANSLVYKGMALGQMGHPSEAITVFDDVISQFGTSESLALQEHVAKAWVNKGFTLGQLNQLEQAIEVFNDLIDRFGDSTEPALQEQVAEALLYNGITLHQQGKFVEAIKSFDRLVTQFCNSAETVLQESVTKGFFGKGSALLMNFKSEWQYQAQAQHQLGTALTSLQQAVSKCSPDELAEILSSLAYTEFLLGQPDQAETHLREALEKGGERLYRATLEDIVMHPIPPDKDFQALLERIWQSLQPD